MAVFIRAGDSPSTDLKEKTVLLVTLQASAIGMAMMDPFFLLSVGVHFFLNGMTTCLIRLLFCTLEGAGVSLSLFVCMGISIHTLYRLDQVCFKTVLFYMLFTCLNAYYIHCLTSRRE